MISARDLVRAMAQGTDPGRVVEGAELTARLVEGEPGLFVVASRGDIAHRHEQHRGGSWRHIVSAFTWFPIR